MLKLVGGFRAVGVKRAVAPSTETSFAPGTDAIATLPQFTDTCGGGRFVPSRSNVKKASRTLTPENASPSTTRQPSGNDTFGIGSSFPSRAFITFAP